MTLLRTLDLTGVGLNGWSAACVVSVVLPTLLHLQDLALERNHLGVASEEVLATNAHHLPALASADLNRVAGRALFH